MSEQKNLITFLDNVERTIIGELVFEDNEILKVRNPVVVNIVPQENQMALQLLPVFFKEFLGDKDAEVMYTYKTASVTRIDFEGGFDFRLYEQYNNIFNPSPIVVPAGAGRVEGADSPVVDLFGSE